MRQLRSMLSRDALAQQEALAAGLSEADVLDLAERVTATPDMAADA